MLVLRNFTVDRNAETFLNIAGRESGVISFLLTLIGLDPTTSLTCTRKEALFKRSSIKGQLNRCIPIHAITCVVTGYKKPFHLLYLAVGFLIGGIFGWALVNDYDGGGGWLLVVGIVLAAISFAIYFLQKNMTFGFYNGGDNPIAFIQAKSSVIEGEKVDFDKFVEAAEILNATACDSRAGN